VQKCGVFFHNFSEADVEEMQPFLTLFPFRDGDILAQQGEPASWCGVVLTGEVEAIDDDKGGQSRGMLSPGYCVGEMSFFRGGVRFLTLIGRGNGALAALLYKDIPEMYAKAPLLAHRLIECFGKSAACKLLESHPEPTGAPLSSAQAMGEIARPGLAGQDSSMQGRRSVVTRLEADPAARMKMVTVMLQKRGLTEAEAQALLKVVTVEDHAAHQIIFTEGKELRHVGIVLHGSVVEGETTRLAGELIGAWCALSGYPVTQRVIAGSQGAAIGCMTIERVRQLAEEQGMLALKALKLIGIAATADAGEQDDESEGAFISISNLGSKVCAQRRPHELPACV
jgi:CRP-like cAMP-binding protein